MNNRILVAVAAVILVGGFWLYQQFGTASLAVTSEPPGAIVSVDGRQRGITPIERLELDVGRHRLTVTHSHFAKQEESFALARGDHEQRHYVMRAGTGELELLSNPRGAWAEVDGQRLPDRTPTRFKTDSGPHLIRMGQSERHVVEEQHILKAGETLSVTLNLNIDPHGSVTFVTQPRGAKVEFVGEDIDYKPKLRVRIGEYAVRVSSPGYVAQEFRYKVRYGDNLHNVKLERAYGQLVVRAPDHAEVQVRYSDRGKTYRKSYAGAMQVPVGQVDVTARSLGYRTAHRKFQLGAKGATIRLAMEQMAVEVGSEVIDKLRSGKPGPTMVVVPAGSFIMGDNDGSYSEKPARKVTLTQPFAVSRYEVSIADYLAYSAATGASLHPKLDVSDPRLAMALVTYDEAERYADWLSDQTGARYRLPSEAEWEYVARAGGEGTYFFGEDPEQLCTYANVADQATKKSFRDWDVLKCDDALTRIGPSGTLAANPFGLYDIYGNVTEWVADCGMPSYAKAPSDGSPAQEGSGCQSHGFRGGAWDSLAIEATSAYRNSASNASDDRGFRLVREL